MDQHLLEQFRERFSRIHQYDQVTRIKILVLRGKKNNRYFCRYKKSHGWAPITRTAIYVNLKHFVLIKSFHKFFGESHNQSKREKLTTMSLTRELKVKPSFLRVFVRRWLMG